MNPLWLLGHRHYSGLGDFCRICGRETRSHVRLCPVWLSTKGTPMLDALKRLIRNEPVRVAAVVAAVVVTVAQQLGIVLDEQSVGEYLVQAFVIVGLAEAARAKVTPVKPPNKSWKAHLVDDPPEVRR